jgi:asparagine synthase (glutamine-hydrolysing)
VFQKRFNPAGLVSLLLTNTITHGEALWQDVRRLDHGHLLIDAPGQLPREIQHYTIPEGKYCAEYAQLSFDEQVALLEETLDRAISQQIEPNGNLTLMLSGGLDSRTLAGLLHRQQVTPQALTLGRRSDLEAACAATVARELGFTQHLIDISPKQFPAYGQIVTQWEHLTGSFSFSSGWGLFSALHKLAPRVMAGYSLDLVLGGPVPDRLFLKPVPFDQFFDCGVNRLGFSPARLTQLLNPSVFGNAVQTSLEKLQFRYENYADTAFRRALRFKLHHRQRLYIGMNAWRLCFGAWPVLPFLNQQLLAVSASMPALTLDSRRAQKAMLCRAFPNLARLPLDRNSYSTAPLQANSLALFDPLSAQWRRLQKKLGFERRYYYRTFDINNIGWQILRRQIEPLRAYAGEFFEPDQFDAWVPPPGNRIRAQEPIGGVNGIRNLLGFLWWAEQHL